MAEDSPIYQSNPRLYYWSGENLSPLGDIDHRATRCRSLVRGRYEDAWPEPDEYATIQIDPDFPNPSPPYPPWMSINRLDFGYSNAIWAGYWDKTNKRFYAIVNNYPFNNISLALVSTNEFLDADFKVLNNSITSTDYRIVDMTLTAQTGISNTDRLFFIEHAPLTDNTTAGRFFSTKPDGSDRKDIDTFARQQIISSQEKTSYYPFSLVSIAQQLYVLVNEYTYDNTGELLSFRQRIRQYRYLSGPTFLKQADFYTGPGYSQTDHVNFNEKAIIQRMTAAPTVGSTNLGGLIAPYAHFQRFPLNQNPRNYGYERNIHRVVEIKNNSLRTIVDLPNPTDPINDDLFPGTLPTNMAALAWVSPYSRQLYCSIQGHDVEHPDCGLFTWDLLGLENVTVANVDPNKKRKISGEMFRAFTDVPEGYAAKLILGPGCR